MKRIKILLLICLAAVALGACSKVPAGNVGVKVYLLGGAKGVDTETLSPGRYWIGWNEDLYLFPTFTQNYVWTKAKTEGSEADESITFQTMEGLSVNTDVGISYHIDPKKVPLVFQKYRKGVEEITSIYLRSMVRDAFVNAGSTRPIESAYGSGKQVLFIEVQKEVTNQVAPIGIIIERIYSVGDFRLPPKVVEAINAKINATQQAQQKKNEIVAAKAEAEKTVAKAQGEANSILAVAEAQAKANRILSESITPELVRYKSIEKWNGVLPRFSGSGAVPFVSMDSQTKK